MPHMSADDRLREIREGEAMDDYRTHIKPGIQGLPAPKKDRRWYGGRSLIAALSMILSGLVAIGMFVLAIRYGVIS